MTTDDQSVAPAFELARGEQFRCGEIFTDLEQAVAMPKEDGEYEIDVRTHRYAILLSQDCDLESYHRTADESGNSSKPSKQLISLLFCPGEELPAIKASAVQNANKPSELWRLTIQNKYERFHVIEKCPTELDVQSLGIPALGFDFRKYFSIEVPDVYRQANENNVRRTRLADPYATHLQIRFLDFQRRIGLPRAYNIPKV